MHTLYKVPSLSEFIEHLRTLGDAPVRGFLPSLSSYRGYYDRAAVEPDTNMVLSADAAAKYLESDIGSIMHGYKGGEYVVNGDLPLYFANYGDTGPVILGTTWNEETKEYELVLLDQGW